MPKRITSLFLAAALCLACHFTVYAHDRMDHDEEIEYVLFGNRDYKITHPAARQMIQALEDAVYLCVDQFNGSGEKELDYLVNQEKIPDIAGSIDAFDYSSSYSRRSLTHRGWNMIYEGKVHWDVRQQILRGTVKYELFPSSGTFLSWFPWLEKKIFGETEDDEKCESFCVFLYCVYVLGDHIGAGEKKVPDESEAEEKVLSEKTTSLAFTLPLAHTEDRENPGLIPELIRSSAILFESQKGTYTYKSFMQELEELRDRSEQIYGSVGGVNTDEKFRIYNGCALELLEVLASYVPGMLRKEEFFSAVFY